MSGITIPYTPEEDALIVSTIRDSQLNISNALDKVASLMPTRTRAGIQQRWYSVLSKRENINILSVVTRNGASKNRKNLKRDDEGILPEQQLKGHLFLLQQILELPSEKRQAIINILTLS